jgi:hypothetical protein
VSTEKNKKLTGSELAKIAKAALNIALALIGYWALSMPPALARLCKGFAVTGVLLTLLAVFRHWQSRAGSNSLLFRWPMLASFLSVVAYGAIRFTTNYFDYHNPGATWGPVVDVVIAFEYATVFSLLSLSFTVLLLEVGKVAEALAELKIPEEQGSHKD